MSAQPLGIACRRDAQHAHVAKRQQLHDQAANSAGRGRDRDRLARLRRHGVHRGVGSGTDDVERAGGLPAQLGGFVDQLVDRDNGVSGVAGTLKAEPEYLVSDSEIADPVPDLDDNAGQVAALAGGKGGGELLMQCAGADSRLTGIDPGGANLDEHLAFTGRRHIDVGHVQHIAPAVAVETDRAGFV